MLALSVAAVIDTPLSAVETPTEFTAAAPAVESVSAVNVMLSLNTYVTPTDIELSVEVVEPEAANVIAPDVYPAETDVPSAAESASPAIDSETAPSVVEYLIVS